MIPIKNIYYMLSYAFQSLQSQGLNEVEVETFDNVQKLCAEILIKGVNVQIKRGLGREYISKTETLSGVKGKIDISDSIKTQSLLRRQVSCTYDDFSINTTFNRIIKSTFLLLLRADIKPSQKKEIRKLLVFFEGVSEIDIYSIDWNYHYNRNNQTYQMLISICYLMIKGLLQTQSDGTIKLMDFFDEQRMSRLYEKFILEYYRKHYPGLSPDSPRIDWQLDDDNVSMLPVMKTDIVLQQGNHFLIIDAKYYSQTTQVHFDAHTVHSGNIYQIFAYVKNKEVELVGVPDHSVSGMLLYAKTDEEIQPEYFTPIVPGRIAYPSRLYFPVDPPVRWISSAQRLAFARYSRMFTLPVSIQIALCTMRSMIASA